MHCQVFRDSIKYSFTLSLIYALFSCANEIEEFRYRFVDGNVVLSDLFKVINVEMKEKLEDYVVPAKKQLKVKKNILQGH